MAQYEIRLSAPDGTNPLKFYSGRPAFVQSYAAAQGEALAYARLAQCHGRTVFITCDGMAIGAVRWVAPELLMCLSADLSRVTGWVRRGYLYGDRERAEAA